MEEGLMPKVIIVAPQALTKGRYIDNLDASRPIASIIAKDLVTAVDARYRTIRHSSARWIEGFSMGGFGTLHLGFRYPDIFGAVSSIAGAMLILLSQEPPEIVGDTFFGNQDFYDRTHPYALVKENIETIKSGGGRKGQMPIRLLGGTKDTRLNESIVRVAERFEELGLEYEYHEVMDVAHDYEWILAGAGDFTWTYWQKVCDSVVAL